MINRSNRFHGHNSLNFLFRSGKTVRTEALTLRYCPSRGDDFRLAVVVSKKVSKSAVVRNRIRRRIFEIVRLYRKELDKPIKFDMSITVFDEKIASEDYETLSKRVCRLLDQAARN